MRVAYHYLAWKAHCSPRTAIRQIAALLALGLIKKVVIRTKTGFAWNLYQYIGPRVHAASPPVKTRCDNVSGTLPDAEREKESSLQDEVDRQRKGLRFYTPGSALWHITCEEIARLEQLRAADARGARAAIAIALIPPISGMTGD